jgi:hypothetical protein
VEWLTREGEKKEKGKGINKEKARGRKNEN